MPLPVISRSPLGSQRITDGKSAGGSFYSGAYSWGFSLAYQAHGGNAGIPGRFTLHAKRESENRHLSRGQFAAAISTQPACPTLQQFRLSGFAAPRAVPHQKCTKKEEPLDGGALIIRCFTDYFLRPLGTATVLERAFVTKRLRLTPSFSALSTNAWCSERGKRTVNLPL